MVLPNTLKKSALGVFVSVPTADPFCSTLITVASHVKSV